MIEEFWKPVLGFEGYYEVSDRGRIRRIARKEGNRVYPEKYMKVRISAQGYPAVSISRPGKKRPVPIHTLVLEAFVGPRPRGMLARHINGDRLDPTLVNLAWGTYRQNCLDAVSHGTHTSFRVRKLNKQQARACKTMRMAGFTYAEIGDCFGVNKYVVYDICRGKTFQGEFKV